MRGGQDPFFVGSALTIFSGIIAMIFLPNIGQDDIEGGIEHSGRILRRTGLILPRWGQEIWRIRSKRRNVI